MDFKLQYTGRILFSGLKLARNVCPVPQFLHHQHPTHGTGEVLGEAEDMEGHGTVAPSYELQQNDDNGSYFSGKLNLPTLGWGKYFTATPSLPVPSPVRKGKGSNHNSFKFFEKHIPIYYNEV